MSTNSYPPLRLALLSAMTSLKERVEADSEFLKAPECPYDSETVAVLEALFAPKIVERIVEKVINAPAKVGRGRPSKEIQLNDEDQIQLETEISTLINELNQMKIVEGLETSEKIQITKTKAGLIDQLLKMRERETTVRRMEEFKDIVIKILDDLVTPADRDLFLQRINPYR